TYLEADDVRAIIARPDQRAVDGWRDHTLLLFLYNCGPRVSEVRGVSGTISRWCRYDVRQPMP
ncbi:MAG: hypothetical protein AB7F22_35995, partial [Reyranella sp.]